MKHTWKAALAVVTVAMIGTAGAARADLNISGETGLILNPTAEIVQKGHPQIQANYYDFDGGDKDKVYGIYGAIQAADKLEVSAGIDKFSSDYKPWDRSGFALGAKYQLLNHIDKGFDLAVGAGFDSGFQRNTHVYVAATKAFHSGADRASVMGTLGVRWDHFNDGDDSKSSQASVYAGVQVPITRTGELSVIGEIQSKNISSSYVSYEWGKGSSAKFPYALGLRYHPRDQAFSVTAGVQRQGFDTPGSTSPKLFVQAGYTFGK
ncbi:MAG: hypothetical protein ABI210_15365 [Abditibacteriaceae bacterium]